jgi:hypothetical protein
VIAKTTENQYCSTQESQTEAWIQGQSFVNCIAGSQSGAACVDFSIGLASEVENEGFGCGRGYGKSKHWAISSGDQWSLLGWDIVTTTLRAAICHLSGDDPLYCNEYEMWDEQTGQCIPYNTPVLVPLTRSQAIMLTSFAQGVSFDFNGDGTGEGTAWTEWNSRLAFLAIDRNGNGKIDSGRELFGNHTITGARNGFDALDLLNQEMGGSKDAAAIDADQPIFGKLLLWEDANHNGISEPNELQPASNVVSAIGLGLQPSSRKDGHGNRFVFRGWAHVRTAPGKNPAQSAAEDRERTINLYDVVFASR